MDSFDNAKDDKGNLKEQGDSFDNATDDKGYLFGEKANLSTTRKMIKAILSEIRLIFQQRER